jgi:DNA helicase IV
MNIAGSVIKLTEEQLRCLDQLEDNSRCLIEGTAGTGKTLIAIEAAKRAAASGEKAALFCFNTMLGQWLKEHFKTMDASLRLYYTGSFHDFIFQIADSAGMAITKPENADQKFWKVDMPLRALEAAEKLNPAFDRIIMDEAQDLITENYLEVFDTLLRGGISRGKWQLFGDFTQQAIFSELSDSEMKALLDERTGFVRYRLRINCRNTKPIGEEIMRLTGFDKQNSFLLKTEGPPVAYYQWKTLEEQRDTLTEILDRLVKKDKIEPGAITVLSPHRREHSVVSMLPLPVANYEFHASQPTFHTIQGFKGLENAVIILTDITSYEQEQLLYIGLSRARSSLIILESMEAHKERTRKKHETTV